GLRPKRLQAPTLIARPSRHVLDNSTQRPMRPPGSPGEQIAAVADVYPDVRGAVLRGRPDRGLAAGRLPAKSRQLHQRDGVPDPAGDVSRPARPARQVPELLDDQIREILHVQDVAHLLAGSAVPDVFKRLAEEMRLHPERDDTLVDLTELPGPGDHAAAVDDRLQAECR